MMSSGLSTWFTHLSLTQIGLILFLGAYVGVLGRLLLHRKALKRYDDLALLPLRRDQGARHE